MRRILKLIWSGSRRVSKQSRDMLRWFSRRDRPIGPRELQLKNLRLLEQAINRGQMVTFSYLNRSKVEIHRRIFPKKLFRRKEVIYCRTFGARGKEYKAFRLDRMNHLKIDLKGKHLAKSQ